MAQNYNIRIRRYNGNDYDTLLPQASPHGNTHASNGNDPLPANSVKTGQIANNSITTSKIASSAVTRDKLANDAQYSPVVTVTTANTVLTKDYMGKTIKDNGNFDNILTINYDTNIPVGAEFAIIYVLAPSFTIQFGDNTLVYTIDSPTNARKISVEKRGMVGLKKFGTYNNRDYWIVTGNVEVIE